MRSTQPGSKRLALWAMIFVSCVSVTAVPAHAQSAEVERRVDKLESELRAVQRKVFPGGDTRYFEPEFKPPEQAAQAGTPATTPVADLTARVDALERQLATLTGQAEQNGHDLRQLRDEFRRFREDTEYRLAAIEDGEPLKGFQPGMGPASVQAADEGAPKPAEEPAALTDAAAAPAGDKATAADSAAAQSPSAAATAGSAQPPADPVEAEYQRAYQFVSNKDYAKAEPALQAFLSKYPKSARASHAQFWLGRSYAAQNSYAQAAKAFLDNYRTLPRGERAPDSLLWLGKSLQKLDQPAEACRAYNELQAAYAGKLSDGFKTDLESARAASKCGS